MATTVLDMSMSLDGFIAGPNETIDNGLGDGGQHLHDWCLPRDAEGNFTDANPTGVDAEMMAAYAEAGASVCGRGTVDPAGGWGGEDYEGHPVFVYARHMPGPNDLRWPKFTYVDSIEGAIAQAKAVAGDKVIVVQGAGTGQAAITAGLIDEIQVHIVPYLLGDGRRLFDNLGFAQIDLEPVDTRQGAALHVRYRIRR